MLQLQHKIQSGLQGNLWDSHCNWWEKSFALKAVALAADAGTGTSLTLTSGGLELKDGDILWAMQTGEMMRVNGDPASDTVITVTRSWGATAATTIDYDGNNVNPNLYRVGNAYEEGSDAPTGINYDPTKKYNYTQIFRNTLEATRTATKTRLRTGDSVREAKRECLEMHSEDMEKAFWFGERIETTHNSKPIRTLGGIEKTWIDSGNVVNVAGASYSMDDIEERMFEMFKYGSSEKMAFVGNRALLTIQQIIRLNASYQLHQGQKEFGMNVSRLVSPFGELVMKSHPLFNQMVGGTTGTGPYYGVESWMFVLDMDDLTYVYIDDTKYEPKLQDNGIDGLKSGYLTECSIEVHHPLNHYLIKGLATAAADT